MGLICCFLFLWVYRFLGLVAWSILVCLWLWAMKNWNFHVKLFNFSRLNFYCFMKDSVERDRSMIYLRMNHWSPITAVWFLISTIYILKQCCQTYGKASRSTDFWRSIKKIRIFLRILELLLISTDFCYIYWKHF